MITKSKQEAPPRGCFSYTQNQGVIAIPKDKQKHMLAGLALSLLAGLLLCPIAGLAAAAVIGALKEIVWDWLLKRGTPEPLDFVATVAGGAIGNILLGLI